MTTPPDEEQDPEQPSRLRAIVGLALLAALVLAVLFVIRELQSSARMQDCLASGRTNCAPIETTSHP